MPITALMEFWWDPEVAVRMMASWVRERLLQLTTLIDSAIAVGLAFDHLDWTADQTGVVMAVATGVLNLVAYADQKQLKDQVALFEFDRDSRGGT